MVNFELILLASVGVVGFCEWLKSFDSAGKLKKVYGLFPLLLSLATGLGFVSFQSFELGTYLISSFVVLGISVLGYEAIIKFIKKKIEKVSEQ